jgi:hypothetical protein
MPLGLPLLLLFIWK